MHSIDSPLGYLDQASLNRLADKHALDKYVRKQQCKTKDTDVRFLMTPKLKKYVNTLTQNLEQKEKNIIKMRYWEDLTLEEIAKVLGLKEIDVQKQITKILAKLRNQILSSIESMDHSKQRVYLCSS